ncbi:hypothetical protein Tco_0868899 [Tanacetum coccineum]
MEKSPFRQFMGDTHGGIPTEIPSPAAFQTDDLDAFDSNCDDAPSTKAVLMANLSSYDSDVLSEVIVDRNAKVADFEKQIHLLKLQLNATVESHKILSTTIECLKKESKQKKDKYLDEVINLQKNKALDNVVYKMGQSTQTMHMLTKPQAFYDESHKTTLCYQNPFYLSQARRKVPTLYDGHTIVKTHVALSITDTEETLELAEESRLKMLAKQNDPSLKENKVNIPPVDYVALNKLSKHFVPQKQLFAEQAFWLPISQPVSEKLPVPSEPVLKKEIPRELPPISLVKDSFHKMKEHVNKFDETITFHTKITRNRIGSWGVEHIKGAFEKDVKPFAQTFKEYFQMFERGLYKELKEMKAVFNQMESEVAKCSVDKKYFEIEKKELSLNNDHLLNHIICRDVMNTIMHANDHSDNVLPAHNNSLEHDNSALELLKHENGPAINDYKTIQQSFVDEYNETLVLKAELAKKDDMIEKLQAQLKAMNVSIEKLKDHIANIKGKNVVDSVQNVHNSNVVTSKVYKLDLPPLSPCIKNNMAAHVDYLKHTQENANILHEIIKYARELRPLDSDLASACTFVIQIHELLVYVSATCPSSKHVSDKLVAVTPMNMTRKVRFAESNDTSKDKTQKQVQP